MPDLSMKRVVEGCCIIFSAHGGVLISTYKGDFLCLKFANENRMD